MAHPFSRLLGMVSWLAIAVLLSGCLQYDADLEVSKSGQLNGEFEWTIPKAAFEASGEESVDRFTGRLAANPLLPLGVRTETIDDNGRVGQRFVFDEVETINLSEVDMPFKVLIGPEGNIDFTADIAQLNSVVTDRVSGAVVPTLDPSVKGTFTMRFPYEIVETNGSINGNEVTWVHDPAQNVFMSPELRAITSLGAAPPRTGEGGLPWTRVLIGFAVLGLVIWLFTGNDDSDGSTPKPERKKSRRKEKKSGGPKKSGSIYRSREPKPTATAPPGPPNPTAQPAAPVHPPQPAVHMAQPQQPAMVGHVAQQPAAHPQQLVQPAPVQAAQVQAAPVQAAPVQTVPQQPAPPQPAAQMQHPQQLVAHQAPPMQQPMPMQPHQVPQAAVQQAAAPVAAVQAPAPAHQPFDLSRLAGHAATATQAGPSFDPNSPNAS